MAVKIEAQRFTELINSTQVVEAGFPAAVKRLTRDRHVLAGIRDDADSKDQRANLRDQRRAVREWGRIVDRYRDRLIAIGNATFSLLPELATSLRLITDGIGVDHDVDLDGLVSELRSIRAAAIRRVVEIGDEATPLADGLQERIDQALAELDLTPQQTAILSYLAGSSRLERTYRSLIDIPGAWRLSSGLLSGETITRALKRLKRKFDLADEYGLTMEIAESKQRVKLIDLRS